MKKRFDAGNLGPRIPPALAGLYYPCSIGFADLGLAKVGETYSDARIVTNDPISSGHIFELLKFNLGCNAIFRD